MAAGLPSFGRIGLRLLLMLRLGMARVAHCVLQDLGGPATLFFGQAHRPVFGQDRLIRQFSTLTTLADWTTEFRAHRATFTVHAPARHPVSVTLFCMTLRPGSTGRSGPGFQY